MLALEVMAKVIITCLKWQKTYQLFIRIKEANTQLAIIWHYQNSALPFVNISLFPSADMRNCLISWVNMSRIMSQRPELLVSESKMFSVHVRSLYTLCGLYFHARIF